MYVFKRMVSGKMYHSTTATERDTKVSGALVPVPKTSNRPVTDTKMYGMLSLLFADKIMSSANLTKLGS